MLGATRSENSFFKSIRVPYAVFTWLLSSILLSSCIGGVQNENSSATKGNLSIKTEGKSVLNNTIIYVLTPDGKVVDSLFYKSEDSGGLFANYIRDYPNSDTIIGDFDGDDAEEIATVQNIKYYNAEDSSINWEACQCVIEFSNVSIKTLIVETCTEGVFKNEGDLNDDGRDEIGILPGWISSGCRQYHVYTFRDNEWVQICEPIENSYNMREAGVVLIEKDKKKGYAVIRQSVDSFISEQENNIPYKYYQGSSCAWSNVVERSIKLR